MKRRDFLEKWGLSNLRISTWFLDAEFSPDDPDREAAWELYVELLTRVATQDLAPEHGDEKASLDSIHAIFQLTRDILRKHGSGCGEFAKLAIPVLNQIIRPFAAKWHRCCLSGDFEKPEQCNQFRLDLRNLQTQLRNYTKALAAMADVEDLTELESTDH